MVAFTFDVRRSDLPLRIAWPLLLLNTIDWFVEEDASYVSSYRTGETWHVPVPAGVTTATIVDPDERRRTVPVVDGRAVYAGTRAGFYEIVAGAPTETDSPEPAAELFAANLGPGDESAIAPADQLAVGDVVASSPTGGKAGVRRELWIYLVLLALAVLSVEWLSYHRRWTV
jgi:hypothetical protein